MFQHKFVRIVSLIAIIFVVTSFTIATDASMIGPKAKDKHVHYANVANHPALKELEKLLQDCFPEWSVKLPQKDELTQKELVHSHDHSKQEEHINNEDQDHSENEKNETVEENKQENIAQNDNENNTMTEEKEQAESNDFLHPYEREVVALTNEERVKNGLAPLEIDEALSKVARDKSFDMQTNNYFDHQSPVYGSPFDMMRAYGIQYTSAGENIARGQQTPQEVVNAWMNSPGHRENILNSDYTHIGVGYVEQGHYWTQQFIRK